ncbi:MAG: NAD(P)/FAD-dependent oxidoreductase [Pyrinomonadaceae bacterium]
MKHYDVAVVGAGLAGLQCARMLGQRGVRVILIDRKKELTASIHTTGIFVRQTLEDFDLPEHLLGVPVRHVVLYSPARRALHLESEHDEFRVGRMGPLYAHYLEDAMRSGVKWAPATRYLGCEQAGENMLIHLGGEGGTQTIKARYLVGADGARSRIARDLDLDENREWIVGVEEVLRNVPLNGAPSFQCFLDPKLAPGYLAWVVNDGEEAHVGVGGYAARFEPLGALEAFKHSLNRTIDLSGATLIEKRGGLIPVGGVLRRIATERGLLIGDAAGAVSPLTAGGLDPCLRLSSLAARVIANYLESGDREALAPYAGEKFRARFVSRLWMRRTLAAVRDPALIELACAAMRLPLLKSLARHVFFGRGSFPKTTLPPAPVMASQSKVFPMA